MKKICCILILLLEAASFAGAYIIHYFTKRKLGMVRYLNFKNMSWEQTFPIQMIQNISILLLFVFAVLILYSAVKRGGKISKITRFMCLAMVVVIFLYVGYTVIFSTETMADYYFICMLFCLAAVLQTINAGVAVLTSKK